MKKIIIALLGLLVVAPSFSYGLVTNAKVVEIRIDQDGKGMVFFDQPVGGDPATCVHPSYKNALAFDMTTAGGKGIMAVALAAKTTGTTMTVYGTKTCTIYGGAHVEDWMYGQSK